MLCLEALVERTVVRTVTGGHGTDATFETVLFESTAVVRVRGEVDLSSQSALETTLRDASAARRIVVADLTSCSYADSSTLSVLIRMNRQFGERLRIVVPRANHIRKIFDITELTERLGILSTLDEAISKK